MISPALVDVVRCPDCARALARDAHVWSCSGCGRMFDATHGYLDLRPREVFAEQTKYLDEALHADARHATVAPPLLGSKIRNDMLRKFLQLSRGERAADLGCGSGRALVWNADTGASFTGVDISPYFAQEALERCDLILGDLRRLPLADGAFTKAWSLDVLEHLSPAALADMLAEANRVLAPGGAFFIYTHVRKNGAIAVLVRGVNILARLLERLGLLDLRQERLRKSDHLNPIADHHELARVAEAAGFQIDRITYYTPVIGALVENIFARMAERWLVRRSGKARAGGEAGDTRQAVRDVRSSAKAMLRRGGATYRALRLVSSIMKLDILLFGRWRSGPFFALLRKTESARRT